MEATGLSIWASARMNEAFASKIMIIATGSILSGLILFRVVLVILFRLTIFAVSS